MIFIGWKHRAAVSSAALCACALQPFMGVQKSLPESASDPTLCEKCNFQCWRWELKHQHTELPVYRDFPPGLQRIRHWPDSETAPRK